MNFQKIIGFAIASLVTLVLSAQQPYQAPLTLDQCIAISLQNNPQLLSSQYTVAESEERVREMRAAYFPTLSLNAGANRSLPVSGKIDGEAYTVNNYNVSLSAHYYLFRGFKTVASSSAALFSYDAATYQHESNRQDLILKITQAYYKLAQAERLIYVAEKSVDRAGLYLDFANARVKAGVASRSDVLKAQVELSNSGLTLIRAKNGRLTAQGALNILLGRTAGSPILIVDDLENLDRNAIQSFDQLVAMAFQQRPELKRFDFQLLAQRSDRIESV
jgi:outer membrane protein TolC